jgi:hypothetical protein
VDERGNDSEKPKGISSFSPALPRSGYAGWWSKNNFYPNGVLSVMTGMMQPVPGRKNHRMKTQGSAPAQPWAE